MTAVVPKHRYGLAPDSNRILFVGGGHHSIVGGTLCLLDPARVALDPRTGEDRTEALEYLTPEVCFPESQGWPKSYFYSPWPLSENYFLVAFSHEPLSGQYTGQSKEGETGLYYLDRFGNLELLFRRNGISAAYPIPLAPRPRPPVLFHTDPAQQEGEGEFLVTDVNRSLHRMPSNRRITQLRVFQLLPKSRTDSQAYPPISHQFAYGPNARMFLGTVPVEEDGSAYFRAPAQKPLYFQAVDADGRAVQSMRSIVYLQPGERRGCIGCHEEPAAGAPHRAAAAFTRPPSPIHAGPEGSFPFGYPRLIQPILDQHCVRCHDGTAGAGKSAVVLSGEPAGTFTRSYESLRPHVRWHEWGGKSITQTVTRPGHCGADSSPLTSILNDANHRPHLDLPDADRRRVYIWLDANAPFYGTYREDAQAKQRAGLAVLPPKLQ